HLVADDINVNKLKVSGIQSHEDAVQQPEIQTGSRGDDEVTIDTKDEAAEMHNTGNELTIEHEVEINAKKNDGEETKPNATNPSITDVQIVDPVAVNALNEAQHIASPPKALRNLERS
ncbi:hypothetical protein HDU76_009383, partial [Blyttiomyces sp. JEL0837]